MQNVQFILSFSQNIFNGKFNTKNSMWLTFAQNRPGYGDTYILKIFYSGLDVMLQTSRDNALR